MPREDTTPWTEEVEPRPEQRPGKSGAAYAASQKLSEAEVLKKGMEQKAAEFKQTGAEVYRKA